MTFSILSLVHHSGTVVHKCSVGEKNCSITFTLTLLNVSLEKMFKVSATLAEGTGVMFNHCNDYQCHLSCLF